MSRDPNAIQRLWYGLIQSLKTEDSFDSACRTLDVLAEMNRHGFEPHIDYSDLEVVLGRLQILLADGSSQDAAAGRTQTSE